MTIQIPTQYPLHLVFPPTGRVISGSRLLFSISLTGIQILFHWSDMGFSSVGNILDYFVCMFCYVEE